LLIVATAAYCTCTPFAAAVAVTNCEVWAVTATELTVTGGGDVGAVALLPLLPQAESANTIVSRATKDGIFDVNELALRFIDVPIGKVGVSFSGSVYVIKRDTKPVADLFD
jgi:hypothetical protein